MRFTVFSFALAVIVFCGTADAQTTRTRQMNPAVVRALDDAKAHRKAGRDAQADRVIDLALATVTTTDSSRLHRMKADIRLQRRDYAGARREIQRAIAVRPGAASLKGFAVYIDQRAGHPFVDGYCELVRGGQGPISKIVGKINRRLVLSDLSTTDVARIRQAVADGAVAATDERLAEELLILDTKLSILAANREAATP